MNEGFLIWERGGDATVTQIEPAAPEARTVAGRHTQRVTFTRKLAEKAAR